MWVENTNIVKVHYVLRANIRCGQKRLSTRDTREICRNFKNFEIYFRAKFVLDYLNSILFKLIPNKLSLFQLKAIEFAQAMRELLCDPSSDVRSCIHSIVYPL